MPAFGEGRKAGEGDPGDMVLVMERGTDGFESLFDGRTFTGWEQKGNWVIEDGAFFRKA